MKTFVITGASTGIGAATARMAVDAGYRVVLTAGLRANLTNLLNSWAVLKKRLQSHVTSQVMMT